MKKKQFIGFIVVMLLVATMAACGKATIENKDICKKWGIEADKTVLRLTETGKATFNGLDYKFTADDKFIYFEELDGSIQKHRYELTKKGLVFYNNFEYTLETRLGDGIMGVWNCGNNSFEFTANYTFLEDGYFTGHYSFDEQAGTIKLMYEHDMQDTTLIYTLKGDKLFIEYPFPYVESK